MIASAWLVAEGYEVYMGQVNASCDLIAMRNGVPIRVEVKAASHYNSSTKPWCVSGVRQERFDMLLVVLPDGAVLVNPPHTLVNQSR